MLSIVHPDDRDGARGAVAGAAEASEPFALEYRIVRADGEVRWVLDRGQLVPGPGGRLWIDGAMFDITERRAAEEALRAPRGRGGPHRRSCAPRARGSSRPPTPPAARIERDLHDGAQQRLVALALDVQRRRARAGQGPDRRRRRSS